MKKQCLTKPILKSAIGANPKAKRLKLHANNDGLFFCPVHFCVHGRYHSKRGCMFIGNMVGIVTLKRSQKWLKFFHRLILGTMHISYCKEAKHQTCQCLQKLKKLDVTLNHGCKLLVEEGKWLFRLTKQWKVLKYLKFCCSGVSLGWNVPETVVDYCLGSFNVLSDFVEYLQNKWKIGYSGIIGYINALVHLLNF